MWDATTLETVPLDMTPERNSSWALAKLAPELR